MGRQQPVARISASCRLIHVALHLERIGDAAVDLGEATQAVASLLHARGAGQPSGDGASGRAHDRHGRRRAQPADRQLCERLPGLDDRIDELDREMAGRILADPPDPERLEGAAGAPRVARWSERPTTRGHRRTGVVPDDGELRSSLRRRSSHDDIGPARTAPLTQPSSWACATLSSATLAFSSSGWTRSRISSSMTRPDTVLATSMSAARCAAINR
jgi:hypothetical protein